MTSRQYEHYREIVARFEELARKDVRDPAKIADLCKAAAISQPPLLRAFRAIQSTTPSGYLRRERLARAREALLSSDLEPQSVTQVAMRFVFHSELCVRDASAWRTGRRIDDSRSQQG